VPPLRNALCKTNQELTFENCHQLPSSQTREKSDAEAVAQAAEDKTASDMQELYLLGAQRHERRSARRAAHYTAAPATHEASTARGNYRSTPVHRSPYLPLAWWGHKSPLVYWPGTQHYQHRGVRRATGENAAFTAQELYLLGAQRYQRRGARRARGDKAAITARELSLLGTQRRQRRSARSVSAAAKTQQLAEIYGVRISDKDAYTFFGTDYAKQYKPPSATELHDYIQVLCVLVCVCVCVFVCVCVRERERERKRECVSV